MLSNIQQSIFKKEQWPNELVLFDINSGINTNNPFGITDWSKTGQSGSANVTHNGYYIDLDRIGTNRSWGNIYSAFDNSIDFSIYKRIKIDYNYCWVTVAPGYSGTASASISFGGYTISSVSTTSGGKGFLNSDHSWTSSEGQFPSGGNVQLFASINKQNSVNANCHAIVGITKVTMLK